MKLLIGAVITITGSNASSGFVDGFGSNVRFSNPSGIALDSLGQLYISDLGNNAIRLMTRGGTVCPIVQQI